MEGKVKKPKRRNEKEREKRIRNGWKHRRTDKETEGNKIKRKMINKTAMEGRVKRHTGEVGEKGNSR